MKIEISGYPISPDFRQRASSNASSCGRLSPRPALVGLELDWNFSPDYQNASINSAQSTTLDQLAGSIAEELKLQKDMMQQGSVIYNLTFSYFCKSLLKFFFRSF